MQLLAQIIRYNNMKALPRTRRYMLLLHGTGIFSSYHEKLPKGYAALSYVLTKNLTVQQDGNNCAVKP